MQFNRLVKAQASVCIFLMAFQPAFAAIGGNSNTQVNRQVANKTTASRPKTVALSSINKQYLEKALKNNVGRLIATQGEVMIDGRRANGSIPVYLGSVIETGAGTATVAFGTDNVVDLETGSRLRVIQIKDPNDSSVFKIAGMLDRGKIRGLRTDGLEGNSDKVSVVTPGGEFGVKSGRYMVEVPETDQSAVKFMSVDHPSQVRLIAPQQLIDEDILRETDSSRFVKGDFFATVDVDGGDGITGAVNKNISKNFAKQAVVRPVGTSSDTGLRPEPWTKIA